MADFYDKAKVEFAKLHKRVETLKEEIRRTETNAEKHKERAIHAARELGAAVQTAKDGGMTGTKAEDFTKNADVAKMLKYIDEVEKSTDALKLEWTKARTEAKALRPSIGDLVNDCDAEIKTRKKSLTAKKLVGAESKSLPLIEKLRAAANDDFVQIATEIANPAAKFIVDKDSYKTLIDRAMKETKDSRDKKDSDAKAAHGLDLRLIAGRTAKARTAQAALVASCKKAVAAQAAGKLDSAKAELKSAETSLKVMVDLDDFYLKGMMQKNADDVKLMQQSSDGAKVLKALIALSKDTHEAKKMVAQVGARLKAAG